MLLYCALCSYIALSFVVLCYFAIALTIIVRPSLVSSFRPSVVPCVCCIGMPLLYSLYLYLSIFIYLSDYLCVNLCFPPSLLPIHLVSLSLPSLSSFSLPHPSPLFSLLGAAWHKACFKCGDGESLWGCNRGLTQDNYSQYGGWPFCKACYTKYFKQGE